MDACVSATDFDPVGNHQLVSKRVSPDCKVIMTKYVGHGKLSVLYVVYHHFVNGVLVFFEMQTRPAHTAT